MQLSLCCQSVLTPWWVTVYIVIEQYAFVCRLSEMRFVTSRTYSQKSSSCCGYNIGWLLSGKLVCRSRWTVYWESSWNHCTQDSWKKIFIRFVRSEVVWFHEIPCSFHIPIDTGMSAFHYTDVFLPAYHPLIYLSLDHRCGYSVLAWYTLAHHSHISFM